MTTPGAEVRAGIYTRISLAALGDNTKVNDQERISRGLAAQLGWTVGEGYGYPLPDGVYCDHSKSAWQKNRKRPAWNQMLRDVDAGKISAIVVYHGDRLVRRPEDLAELMKLADSKGVKLASPTGTKDLDTERLELWIRAAFAEEESQRTSERRKSQYERWRLAGKVRPGGRGGRAFGFGTDGNVLADDRCVIATRELTGEPRIIREMAARVLAGEGASEIARDATARGWRTPAGRPFTPGTVRKMLARARYAGLMPDGVSPASWEAILERDTWEAVVHALDARAAGFTYASNARRHLLSGIARCGMPDCGKPMQIWQSKGRAGSYVLGYRCSGCRKLFRSQPLLDAYVSGAVTARLAKEGNPSGRAPQAPGLAKEFAALTEARAEAEKAITDPSLAGRLTLLLARLDSIDGRLGQLRELAGDSARHRLLAQYAGITDEEFGALPLQVRRSLVAACFTVTVLPASRRGPGFRSEDVRLTPR